MVGQLQPQTAVNQNDEPTELVGLVLYWELYFLCLVLYWELYSLCLVLYWELYFLCWIKVNKKPETRILTASLNSLAK